MADSTPLTFWTKVAYGAGTTGVSITGNILAFFALFFFTDVAGLPAALAGSLLMIGKITDAVSDPVVGWLSDRTKSRWGRRYPWMIFGVIPFAISFVLIWVIPTQSQWWLFAYYAVVGIVFNLAYTVIFLPYVALTPELTHDYNERTNLNSFRFTFAIGSSILALGLAKVLFNVIPNPAYQYLTLALIAAAIALIMMYWCVRGTWTQVMWLEHHRPRSQSEISLPFRAQARIVFSNRPFLMVMGIYLCSWLSAQMTAIIMPYFVVNWMGETSVVFTQFALVVQGTALLMLFVWSAISQRVGKRSAYMMGMGFWILAQAGLFFLQPGQISLMFFLGVVAGFGVSVAYLVPWSMLPDVIELDELRTGQRREGVFSAFMIMLQKLGLAFGVFVVGQALSLAGYIENTTGQSAPVQPESVLWVIRIVIGPLGTLLLLGGIILAYFYPITRQTHAEILLQLAKQHQDA